MPVPCLCSYTKAQQKQGYMGKYLMRPSYILLAALLFVPSTLSAHPVSDDDWSCTIQCETPYSPPDPTPDPDPVPDPDPTPDPDPDPVPDPDPDPTPDPDPDPEPPPVIPPSIPPGVAQCPGVDEGRAVYEVGTDTYPTFASLPEEAWLSGNVTILVHPGVYHEKLQLARDNMSLCGVPAEDGTLPVIDGNGAVSVRVPSIGRQLHDAHARRGIVIVAKYRDDEWEWKPKNIQISNLHIRNTQDVTVPEPKQFSFTRWDGATGTYAGNAAVIWGQVVDGLVLTHNIVEAGNNGILAGGGQGEWQTVRDLVISRNVFVNNSSVDSSRHHAIYIEADHCLVEHNKITNRVGALGSGIKSRCGRDTVRYNYFDSATGAFALTLVELEESSDPFGPELGHPYGQAYVYGNVFLQGQAGSAVIRLGQDNGTYYAREKVYLYNTTVVCRGNFSHSFCSMTETQPGTESSGGDPLWTDVHMWNNVYSATGTLTKAGLTKYNGEFILGDGTGHGGNWMHSAEAAITMDREWEPDNSLNGTSNPSRAQMLEVFLHGDPMLGPDGRPLDGSPLVGQAVPLPDYLPPVEYNADGTERGSVSTIGAFEVSAAQQPFKVLTKKNLIAALALVSLLAVVLILLGKVAPIRRRED